MSKKSFTGGLSSLLGDETPQPETKQGRPSPSKETRKQSEEGCKAGETRATFILNEELLDKLKAVAYWKRLMIKEALEEALDSYLTTEEVKPRPERERKKEQAAIQKRMKQAGVKARLPQY